MTLSGGPGTAGAGLLGPEAVEEGMKRERGWLTRSRGP